MCCMRQQVRQGLCSAHGLDYCHLVCIVTQQTWLKCALRVLSCGGLTDPLYELTGRGSVDIACLGFCAWLQALCVARQVHAEADGCGARDRDPQGYPLCAAHRGQQRAQNGPHVQVRPLCHVSPSPCLFWPQAICATPTYPVEFVKGGGMEKPVAILFIRLVEAQKLPNTDIFSKTDCYVRWSWLCPVLI